MARSKWAFKLSQWLQRCKLPIKARLGIVFGSLMLVAVIFAMFLVFREDRMTKGFSERSIVHHNQMVNAVLLQEALRSIQRQAVSGRVDKTEISRFINLLNRREINGDQKEFQDLLKDRFDYYVDVLMFTKAESNSQILMSAYQDVAATVSALVEMDQANIYRSSESYRVEHQRSMRTYIPIFLLFLLVALIVGHVLISVITRPISAVIEFLDRANVEDDLPIKAPNLNSCLPEVARMFESFEGFYHRFSGYKALNLRRLLMEKTRADIIAASISDGVILLRGEEVLYANHIGDRILGVDLGTAKELHLSELLRRNSSQGAGAVLTAISRTLPIDHVIEGDWGRTHYLIQTHPISQELLKEMVGSSSEEMSVMYATTLVVAQDVTLVREGQQAKEHFLATLSHEIKTPVTSLTMATRLLKKSVDQITNPIHRSLVLTCADDVDRLRGLLNYLLNVSSLDTLTQRLEIQETDFAKLLRHTVQPYKMQAKQRGIDLNLEFIEAVVTADQVELRPYRSSSVMIPIDPTKITWALTHLMTNALRHTPPQGYIKVSLVLLNDWVEVRIKDSGPGIEKRRQSRIFEKSNANYDLRVARSGTTGMGLAITREIVIAHRGRIWVSSEPGHGAEFCFSLPCDRKTSMSSQTSIVLSGTGSGDLLKGGVRGASASG